VAEVKEEWVAVVVEEVKEEWVAVVAPPPAATVQSSSGLLGLCRRDRNSDRMTRGEGEDGDAQGS